MIIHNFDVPKGQDCTVTITIVTDAALTLTTANITSWTARLELRATWGITTVSFSTTTVSVDNTAKTLSFTIAKADTQDLATGRYVWSVRRTNAGSEKALAGGNFNLTAPPPFGKVA